MKSFCDDFFSIGVDMVWMWYWCGSDMLRWCGHSVSGSGPEPCQVSTLLLGDTGPPFQLIGRLLLSPHPPKTMWKSEPSLFQSVLSNWDRLASGGEIITWGLNLWTEVLTNYSCFDLFTFVNIPLRKEECWCLVDNLTCFFNFRQLRNRDNLRNVRNLDNWYILEGGFHSHITFTDYCTGVPGRVWW